VKSSRVLMAFFLVALAGCGTHYPTGMRWSTAAPPPLAGAQIYHPGSGTAHGAAAYATLIGQNAVAIGKSPVTSDQLVHVSLFVEDANAAAAADPATLLFESRLHSAVVAPDGHQLTLAEFNAVRGTLTARCLGDEDDDDGDDDADGRTHTTLTLTGLIPNGLYSVWIVSFSRGGYDAALSRLLGLGTLGPADGSQSTFTASSADEGSITAITPGGKLSVQGRLHGCALDHEAEIHVVGAYHINGRSYGPDLGPEGAAVEQFAFALRHP
jgi:hypothetical protein